MYLVSYSTSFTALEKPLGRLATMSHSSTPSFGGGGVFISPKKSVKKSSETLASSSYGSIATTNSDDTNPLVTTPIAVDQHISYKNYLEINQESASRERRSDTESLTSKEDETDRAEPLTNISIPPSPFFEEIPIPSSTPLHHHDGLIGDDEESPLLLSREESRTHRLTRNPWTAGIALGPWDEKTSRWMKQVGYLAASIAVYLIVMIVVYFVLTAIVAM